MEPSGVLGLVLGTSVSGKTVVLSLPSVVLVEILLSWWG
jgi:hypothetical protein